MNRLEQTFCNKAALVPIKTLRLNFGTPLMELKCFMTHFRVPSEYVGREKSEVAKCGGGTCMKEEIAGRSFINLVRKKYLKLTHTFKRS